MLESQAGVVQDRGSVRDSGLHLDPGPVPDKPLLPDPVHRAQLTAGNLPLRRPLFAQQRGDVFIAEDAVISHRNIIIFIFVVQIREECLKCVLCSKNKQKEKNVSQKNESYLKQQLKTLLFFCEGEAVDHRADGHQITMLR